MAKIERFEELQSWQKARQLTNFIYDLTEHSSFSKDFRTTQLWNYRTTKRGD